MNAPSTQGQQQVALKGVRIQSSTFGSAQALVYGTTRVTINMIGYTDFSAVQTGGGGK